MSEFLTKDEILGSDDRVVEIVEVPEWGHPGNPNPKVRVMALSGEDRDAFELSMIVRTRNLRTGKETQSTSFANVRAKLAAMSIVDENGQKLFSLAEAEALGRKSSKALQRVYDVAQRISGISAEDIEELEGNSNSDLGAEQ